MPVAPSAPSSDAVLSRLPAPWPHDPLPAIRTALAVSGRKVVVLDDDPTGTQTVHDVPVLTEWSIEALADALASPGPVFYILTNSRSLPPAEAAALNEEIARHLTAASDRATRGFEARRAIVRGQIHPGVPVWELGAESRCPGLVYVVFPGNVGGPDALAEVVGKLDSGRKRRGCFQRNSTSDMSIASSTFLYGGMSPSPALRPLRAGPLTMFYEEGGLRYIKLGEREVIRRIHAAVRDHNWGTPPGRLSNERIEAGEDGFVITFDMRHHEGDVDFSWTGRIAGDAGGTITFRFDGIAHSTFRRNRIGLCVLHPARECPGAALRVESADGSIVTTEFPRVIAAQNPHADIRALTHEVAPGLWCRLEFAGELFEMEDQRNWVDASFKTFCTPLRRPFPVELLTGARVNQSVRLSLEGRIPDSVAISTGASAARPPAEITIDLAAAPGGPLPALGLALAPRDSPWSGREIARLRALRLSHVRVELTLGNSSWLNVLGSAAARARSLDLPVEVALFVSEDPSRDLPALASCLETLPVRVVRWLVFQRGEPGPAAVHTMENVRRILEPHTTDALFGSGTDTFFVFMNRNRPAPDAVDFLCYSLNPQVHASDHRSLVETLEAHVATVEATRRFSGGKPIVVSPITLRMRYNPAATAAETLPAAGELPAHVDPRQMSLFGAAWTLGSIKYLAEAGVAAATYFETTGWLGVMETETGSPLPDQFPSTPGTVFPMYHVFADVGGLASGRVVPLRSNDPLRVDGLALADGNRRRVLLANMTGEPQSIRVRLPAAPAGPARLRRLDERNVEIASRSPEDYRSAANESIAAPDLELRLELKPCEIARLDFETRPTPSFQ